MDGERPDLPVEDRDDGIQQLRQIRDEALAADTGIEIVDAYERAAIMQAWNTLGKP